MTGGELLTLGKALLWFLVPLLLAVRELLPLRGSRSSRPGRQESGRVRLAGGRTPGGRRGGSDAAGAAPAPAAAEAGPGESGFQGRAA